MRSYTTAMWKAIGKVHFIVCPPALHAETHEEKSHLDGTSAGVNDKVAVVFIQVAIRLQYN